MCHKGALATKGKTWATLNYFPLPRKKPPSISSVEQLAQRFNQRVWELNLVRDVQETRKTRSGFLLLWVFPLLIKWSGFDCEAMERKNAGLVDQSCTNILMANVGGSKRLFFKVRGTCPPQVILWRRPCILDIYGLKACS